VGRIPANRGPASFMWITKNAPGRGRDRQLCQGERITPRHATPEWHKRAKLYVSGIRARANYWDWRGLIARNCAAMLVDRLRVDRSCDAPRYEHNSHGGEALGVLYPNRAKPN